LRNALRRQLVIQIAQVQFARFPRNARPTKALARYWRAATNYAMTAFKFNRPAGLSSGEQHLRGRVNSIVTKNSS
jgi:hypothetical protein